MASDIVNAPAYRHTMRRLEEVKRSNSQGDDYWVGHEIVKVLGYGTWDSFKPVIERAEASMRNAGADPSQHIRHTTKMVGVGSGASRRVGEALVRLTAPSTESGPSRVNNIDERI